MSKQLCFVTLNIAHGRGTGVYQGFTSTPQLRKNVQRIAAFLQHVGADIVALQEVDEDSHWHRGENLVQMLQAESKFPHALMGVNTRRQGRKPLAYGNAILSRYPVHYWTNNPFGAATLGEKGFLYAEVDIGAVHLPIINLHLDFRSRRRRIAQAEQIISYVGTRQANTPDHRLPPIVCGDFNTSAKRVGDAVEHLFNYILTHGPYTLHPAGKRTFPSHFPSRALDFVFLPDCLTGQRSIVSREILSDHRPVIAYFDLPQ